MTSNDRASRGGAGRLPAGEPARLFACGSARLELLPARPYEARYVAETDGVGFAFDLQRGVHAFGSDRPSAFHTRPNSVAFVPRGCDVYSRSPEGGEYLVVALQSSPETPLANAARFTDAILPAAVAAAHRLRARLLEEAVEPLLVEEGVHDLLERVALQAFPAPCRRAAERWMTPARLRTVSDMIEARLDGPLAVEDLASALGLSAGFFTRAFRAATARSPHSYVIDRRIARARRLLLTSRQGLAGIALAAGFSSHAHMTATFRERLGISPAEFRRRHAPDGGGRLR